MGESKGKEQTMIDIILDINKKLSEAIWRMK